MILDKKWVIKPKGDTATVTNLCKAINVSENIGRLLVQRGITGFDEAKKIFQAKTLQIFMIPSF